MRQTRKELTMHSTMIIARLALSVTSQALADTYARELDNLGFSSMHATPRGVQFKGPIDLFERTFKSRVTQSEARVQFDSRPVIPAPLKEGVDSVYFPTKPLFFG